MSFAIARYALRIGYLLAAILGVGLIAPQSALPLSDDCKEAVPGKLTAHVDNNVSEEEARQLLSEFGVVVDSIQSISLIFRFHANSTVDLRKLKRDPQVSTAYFANLGFGPLQKDRRGVETIFKSSVTDAYAYRLIDSLPDAKIVRVRGRRPRLVQISVPEGQEDKLRSKLSRASFVSKATRVCKSEFRIACEKFGGSLTFYEDGEERDCDLPEPAVAWASVLDDKQSECQRVGGAWMQFSDGCVDSCSFVQAQICTTAITPGCECGPARCWYGKKQEDGSWKGTCVDHPDWYQQILSH